MKKAVELWRAAADQGHGLSKYQMGVCHVRGIGGLAIDLDRALRYMEAASSIGVPEAKTYLAAHEYKRGHLEGAKEFLRQAIAGGDEKAQEILEAWPAKDKGTHLRHHHHHDRPLNGYPVTFSNELNDPVAKRNTKRVAREGRNRFWGSTSSEEDSFASSSSSLYRNETEKSGGSSSSVMFCDESSASSESKIDKKSPAVVEPRILETVASLLNLGSLRRTKTAPADFHGFDHLEPAIVMTGNVGGSLQR